MATSTYGARIVAIAAAGAGTGWLAGISLSPVANIVVASVVGLSGALVAALAGVELEPKAGEKPSRRIQNIDAIPIAVFAVILGIVATVGVVVRNAEWLSFLKPPVENGMAKNLKQEVEAWVSLGAKKEDVVQTLLQARVHAGPSPFVLQLDGESKSDKGGLYSVDVKRCSQIRGSPESQTKGYMLADPKDVLGRIANIDMAASTLKLVAEELCKGP